MTEEKLKSEIDSNLKFYEVKNKYDCERINIVDDEFWKPGMVETRNTNFRNVDMGNLVFPSKKIKS